MWLDQVGSTDCPRACCATLKAQQIAQRHAPLQLLKHCFLAYVEDAKIDASEVAISMLILQKVEYVTWNLPKVEYVTWNLLLSSYTQDLVLFKMKSPLQQWQDLLYSLRFMLSKW